MDQTPPISPFLLTDTPASQRVPPQLISISALITPPTLRQIQTGVEKSRVILVRFTGIPLTVLLAIIGTLLIHILLLLLYFFSPIFLVKLPASWGFSGKGDGAAHGSGSTNGAFIIEGADNPSAGSRLTTPNDITVTPVDPVKIDSPLQSTPASALPDVASVLVQPQPDPVLAMSQGTFVVPVAPAKASAGTPVPSAGGSGQGVALAGNGRGSARVDLGGAGTGDGDDDTPLIPTTKAEVAGGLDRGGSGGTRQLDVKDWGPQLPIPMRFMKEAQNFTEFFVTVNTRGLVESATISKSCGSDDVDQIRLLTMKQTTFKPRVVNGKAVQSTDFIRIGGRLP